MSIYQTMKAAVEILDNHKFGAKRKDLVEKAKENAKQYNELIKTLDPDLQKIMKLLWMAEYKVWECKEKKDKEMLKKFQQSVKNIRKYVDEDIRSIVWP